MLQFLIIAVIVGLCWIAKVFWDRLGKWIMQSAFGEAFGEWYKRRPWKTALSIVIIILLLFLFWCLGVYGFLIVLGGGEEISVLVSLVIFGFLILGACWSIAERLQREGLNKKIIQTGIPAVAIGILILTIILLVIADSLIILLIIPIITGIVIGTIFLITMFLFRRSDFFDIKKEKGTQSLGVGRSVKRAEGTTG